MAGLLDYLINQPSAAETALPFLQQGTHDPRASADIGMTPSGKGIFFNDDVNVLQPGDPRLRSIGGTELARPAARSIREVLQSLGIPVQNIGGGYRSAAEQQAMLDRGAPAAPVGSSFHQEGVALDLTAALQNPRVFNALEAAGWNQLRGEPWHWTYGAYG